MDSCPEGLHKLAHDLHAPRGATLGMLRNKNQFFTLKGLHNRAGFTWSTIVYMGRLYAASSGYSAIFVTSFPIVVCVFS